MGREKSVKMSFSKTILPERLKRVWNHPQVVYIPLCSGHDPRGKVGL